METVSSKPSTSPMFKNEPSAERPRLPRRHVGSAPTAASPEFKFIVKVQHLTAIQHVKRTRTFKTCSCCKLRIRGTDR